MNDLDDFFDQDLKQCAGCREEKPLEDFYKQPTYADGRQRWCKDCHKKRNPNLYKQDASSYRHRTLRSRYGIGHDDYLKMLEDQDGGCVICFAQSDTQKHGVLCVDHNHETGEVRGLLCNSCNTSLGRMGDDPQRLLRAAQYLLDRGDYSE